jgi:hypothetical protein
MPLTFTKKEGLKVVGWRFVWVHEVEFKMKSIYTNQKNGGWCKFESKRCMNEVMGDIFTWLTQGFFNNLKTS